MMHEAFHKKSGRKIVYYGPEQSGKSTNLDIIFNQAPEENRSQLLSLNTEDSPPLFYDYLKLSLDNILQRDSKFELFTFPGKATQTLPGQAIYYATQRKLLADIDGLIFVFDSQTKKLQENMNALKMIEDFFFANQINIATFPIVLQYNKRDLQDILSIEQLNERLNKWNYPYHSTIATQGVGVFQTLKTLTRLIFNKKKGTPDLSNTTSSSPSEVRSSREEQLQDTDTYYVPAESMPSSPQIPQYPYPNPNAYPAPSSYPQQPYYQAPYPQPPSSNYMYPQNFSPSPYPSASMPPNTYAPNYPNTLNTPNYPIYPTQPSAYAPPPANYPQNNSGYAQNNSGYGMETSSFSMPANPSVYNSQNPYPQGNAPAMGNYQNSGYGGNMPYSPPSNTFQNPPPNNAYGMETSSFSMPIPPGNYLQNNPNFQGNSPYPQPPSSNYLQPPSNASYGTETSSFSMPIPPPDYPYANPNYPYTQPPSQATGYSYKISSPNPSSPSSSMKFETPRPFPPPRAPGEETDLFPKPQGQFSKPKFPFPKPPQNPPPF